MPQYWLKFRGTRFPLRRGETLLGRSPYCSIVLGNPLASREHCVVQVDDGGLTLVDLESSNGTTVNGQRASRARLVTGDVIRVGTDVLEVVLDEAAPVAHRLPATLARKDGEEGNDDFDTASFDFDRPAGSEGSIAFIEQLVNSAGETQNPVAMLKPIQMAVDGFVIAALRSGARPAEVTSLRLLALVERVTGWVEDGSLDDWRSTIRRGLGFSS